MILHPRHTIVKKAEFEFCYHIDVAKKYNIHIKEMLSCFAHIVICVTNEEKLNPNSDYEKEVHDLFNKVVKNFELTLGEQLSMLCNEMSRYPKYIIRHERHPDNPDKKGDEY